MMNQPRPARATQPERVFVAGATGVVGRRVVPLLVAAGHEVIAAGRTPDKRRHLAELGARAVDVDLFDRQAVRRATAGVDAIINLATAVPPGWWALLPLAWRQMDRVRREVSAHLASAALAHGSRVRMIQESVAAIYPDRVHGWLDESAPTRPASHIRSVLDAERNALELNLRGLTGVCLRFGFFYGPDDAPTARLFDSIRRGRSPLLGAPAGFCSWVHHEDAAHAVVAALELPGGIYNVAEDDPLPKQELAAGLAHAMGVKPPQPLPAWTARLTGSVGETLARSLRVSNRKFKDHVRWAPRHVDALSGMCALLRSLQSQSPQ